jgi:hypothetical protein
MQTELTKITEELQRKATVCETIAQDKTEEALTGASCEKELNEQDAKAWRLKSQVWVEAEAIVRAGLAGEPPPAKPDVAA